MKILVEPDGRSFRLMCCDDRMDVMPAGPRLFRGPPIPDIQFAHEKFADAVSDARTLQRYIEENHGRTQTAPRSREGGAFS